jgi:cytosine/adenosine deaminase-related metal-dependent hydrolase
LTRFHAAWVVPISQPPIRDGWVDVENGRVVDVGHAGRRDSGHRTATKHPFEDDLGEVALMPGLVNAHTHLELSHLRGAIPRASEFVSWIRDIMAARSRYTNAAAAEIVRGVERGIEEAIACGTALLGDISNTMVTVEPLTHSPLGAVVFNELIRFKAEGAERVVAEAVARNRSLPRTKLVRLSLAAHAPYSVAPALFAALRAQNAAETSGPLSVHLAESREEVSFIRDGTGPWRTLLEEVGAWDSSWTPAGVSPVEYLDRQGFLDSRVLAVHGVQMTSSDLACLTRRGSTLVTCPRSNVFTGAGTPPLDAFYASGVTVAVGTDSHASTPDLNVFSELAAIRTIAPGVPPSALLASATEHGARALGFASEFGAIAPGRRARLIAVTIPHGTDDVERYLVSGIEPDRIRWIS